MLPLRHLLLSTAIVCGSGLAAAQPRQVPAPPAAATSGPAEKIVAVVNGDAITTGDVAARGRI